MTVVFIKRECDQHPGCYTLTDKCERCVDEDFHAGMDAIWAQFRNDVARIFAGRVGGDGR